MSSMFSLTISTIQKMMNREVVLQIKTLETDSTYFGLIIGLSEKLRISKIEAWKMVEKRRRDWGLKPRFTTLMSYRMGEHRYILAGKQIEFEIPQIVFDSF